MHNGIDVDAWRKRIRDDTFSHYHFQMGIALQATGDSAATVAAFERVLAIDPDNAVAHYGVVSGLRQLGRAAEAETAHRQALAHAPDYQSQGMVAYACELIARGRSAEAESVFTDLLALKPDSREAGAFLHYTALGQGRREAGELSPDLVAQHEPGPMRILGDPYMRLAWRFASEQRLAEMMDAFEHALDAYPSLAVHMSNIGMIYWATGRLDRIVRLLHALVRRDSALSTVWNWLGQTLLVLGRPEEAMEAHRHALAINEQDPAALPLIGNLLQSEGRLDEAASWYQQASQIRPNDIWLLSGRALVEVALGRPGQGLDLQQEVVRLFPGARDLGWLGTNIALVEQGNGLAGAALASHRRAIAAEPHTLGFHARMRPWALPQLTAAYEALNFDPTDLRHATEAAKRF